MTERKISPGLKLVLEIGPILAFFLAYRWAPVDPGLTESEANLSQMIFATIVFIPLILITLGISWMLTRHLPKMAVLTAILVIVFGGLTIWLRDDTFIKMKPTWMTFTWRFAAFFLVLAIANEVVWRTMSTDTWVNFKTFVLPIASFAFVISQVGLFSKYAEADEPDDG